jgi:DNA-binding transcriptional ArsR family regulator
MRSFKPGLKCHAMAGLRVLRVHLTAEDLLRTRFASQPAPLIEAGLALAAMQRPDPAFGNWRRWATARLPVGARPLLDLIPASATGPLFLDPVSTSLAEGLELVQQAPMGFVRQELQRAFPDRPRPSWVPLLAARDRQTWRDLDRALRLAYQHLVARDWARVCGGFQSELAWRSRLIAELGVQTALSTLHPRISWDGTVMQISTSKDLDVRPRGAGVTLLPSTLWTGRPMIADHPDGSTAIVYPALTPLPLIDEASPDPLSGLLGHTRAAVLRLAFREHTTTELARELGTSAATVSGHTKTLRAAGLIVTARAGKAVLHSVTPLGGRLLESASGGDPQPRIPPPRPQSGPGRLAERRG